MKLSTMKFSANSTGARVSDERKPVTDNESGYREIVFQEKNAAGPAVSTGSKLFHRSFFGVMLTMVSATVLSVLYRRMAFDDRRAGERQMSAEGIANSCGRGSSVPSFGRRA